MADISKVLSLLLQNRGAVSDEELLGQIRSDLGKEIRKQLKRDSNIAGMPSMERARHNRGIRSKVREFQKRISSRERISKSEQLKLLRDIRPSPILDSLYPARNDKNGWKKFRERKQQTELEIDLRNFSLLDNPIETIAGLKSISEAESYAANAKLNFRDEYCLDVVPYMLLNECWSEMIPIFSGGFMDIPMQKVLASMGFGEAMDIQLKGAFEFSNVWAFPLYERRRSGTTRSENRYTDAQTREYVSSRFCDALDEWLSNMDLELSQEGIGWISNLLGELLENAERHSDGVRRDGKWAVSGFMARRRDSETDDWIYRAHIGIVSLGDSFSKSLERALPEVCNKLDEFVDGLHSLGATQSRETLRTLAAIQDGVTCVPEADADKRGGYGLMEMLDLVNMLGHTTDPSLLPKVTIISGNSCIRLRSPYIRGRKVGPNSPRLLWCNESNSLDEKPNDAYVFDLETGLPGTAISIGFVLDKNYLENVAKAQNHDKD